MARAGLRLHHYLRQLGSSPFSVTDVRRSSIRRFGIVCARPVRLESLSDWAANVLLFIPFGYLLMAALTSDRSLEIGLFSLPWWWSPACALLSVSVEFAQLFVPERVSSLNDIVAETTGGILGVRLLWLGIGRQLTAWSACRGKRTRCRRPVPVELLLGLSPCCPDHAPPACPSILTLSPHALWHKYRDGRVRPVPFFPWLGVFETIQKQLHQIAYYAPVGLILTGLPGRRWRELSGWQWVLLVGLGLAGFIEFGQLFCHRPCQRCRRRVWRRRSVCFSGWMLRTDGSPL